MEVKTVSYRKIDALSASDIKLFDKNRFDFYRFKVLGEKRKDKSSDSIVLGSLIDFALSDCLGDWNEFETRFDEKFMLLSVKKGTGQMFLLADLIFEYTLRDTDADGNVQGEFSDRFQEAFDRLQTEDKFKGKTLEWALTQFKDDIAIYFNECLLSIDRTPVDQWMLDRAKSIVENTIYDDNVGHLFRADRNIQNLGKTVIEWEFSGLKAKSELDNLSIYHEDKKIVITEIKSNWEIEDFQRTYLKLRYDLAACYYDLAVQYWVAHEMKELEDYEIKFQFLVVDTSQQNLRPIIYTLTQGDLSYAYGGFTTKAGYKYKGLKDLVKEIKWCQETNNWLISKEAHDSKSVLPLTINYEI
jgi:hypothetical protein